MKPVAYGCLVAYTAYRLYLLNEHLNAYKISHSETDQKIAKIKEETCASHREHLKLMASLKNLEPSSSTKITHPPLSAPSCNEPPTSTSPCSKKLIQ